MVAYSVVWPMLFPRSCVRETGERERVSITSTRRHSLVRNVSRAPLTRYAGVYTQIKLHSTLAIAHLTTRPGPLSLTSRADPPARRHFSPKSRRVLSPSRPASKLQIKTQREKGQGEQSRADAWRTMSASKKSEKVRPSLFLSLPSMRTWLHCSSPFPLRFRPQARTVPCTSAGR